MGITALDCFSRKNISDPRNVAIAIIKRPATVSTTDPRFRGTLISNPGGPGQSGTQMVLRAGRFIQQLVDGEDHKYELVSFDPRGVWQSTPSLDCFEGKDFARGPWKWEKRIMGNLDGSSQAAIQAHLAAARACGGFCKSSKHDFAEHVSTAAVARDMLEIVDRVESERKEQNTHRDQELLSADSVAKIQYLGFSYGTHLGNTFASLFPDKVKRMILDGVVDSYAFTGTRWPRGFLQDAEKVVDHFYNTCFEAKESCALYKLGYASPDDIRNSIQLIFNMMKEAPLYLTPCYSPVIFFPLVAEDLDQLSRGQYTDIVNNNPELVGPAALRNAPCDDAIGGSDPVKYWDYAAMETGFSVICGDRVDVRNTTAEELARYIQQMVAESPSIGSLWATFYAQCAGWPYRARWAFHGPFRTPPPGTETGPNAPLLFLSSEFDPVTPLAAAISMAEHHPNSLVVKQHSYGHTALFAAPSNSTREILREYMHHGKLPEPDWRSPGGAGIAECDADCSNPWLGCPKYRSV
ncbi:alpha/beta-hydrolase [Aspergillus sclerotioniger CBS 115572]|uniref:Alpha/beta-hydrolase n=1 Tax=Aspergillus sclerotioniger CBS 115572 TaxID=1450535 RepID=A0A317VZQ4_9EURO|nr:alpha/beta-hydrolase [Aspergillus sclerotioniger CBS 115572]PWY78492.1 alpha/beta-hydrolase [Aspergillus sclerotioniger CBS 115572]